MSDLDRAEPTTAALIELYPALASVDVEDLTIAGPHGDVPARLYVGPQRHGPALVWLHGGAWVFGTLDMPEAHWVGLTLAAAGIPVLSADYRKASGGLHFPVPLDDAVAAWRWAAAHLGDRIDRHGPLHLGGASAGGNLAAGAAMHERDHGEATPGGLVLAYAALHGHLPPPAADLQAAIDDPPPGGFLFPPDMYADIALNYVGTEAARVDPHAFPANGDVAGLPRTYLVNAEHDTIRASAEAFAVQLSTAGVDATIEVERGALHGYLNEPRQPFGSRTLERMAAWICPP